MLNGVDVDDEARKAAVTLALSQAGRLFADGALGGELLVIEGRCEPGREDAHAVALVAACEPGATACEALHGPARAMCWWGTAGKFGLFVPLAPADPELKVLWARALARGCEHGDVPAARFSLMSCPEVPGELQAQVTVATRRAERWEDLARHGHPAGRQRPGAGVPAAREALAQAERWRGRERRLKLQAAAPLLEGLADAVAVSALPDGPPLQAVLDSGEHPLVFDLLGERAAAGDLAALSDRALRALGLERSLRVRLRRR